MEKIPEQWVLLRRKAGGPETRSILDLVWYPGYEGAYQDFLDWVRNATKGYTAGAGELAVLTHLPGYKAPFTFVPSVWSTAVALRAQARHAFSGIIKEALAGPSSEGDLLNKLQMTWSVLEGTRHSEIQERLRTLSHAALGWYKNFARKYFMMQAPTTIATLAVWKYYVRKLLVSYLSKGAGVLALHYPRTARVIGYALRPIAELRRNLWGLRYIPGLVKKFISALKGLGPGGSALGIAQLLRPGELIAPSVLSGIVAGLLAVLLTNFRVEAPTLTDRDLDAIYKNPQLTPYRQEVARVAARVHDIENEIHGLESSKLSGTLDKGKAEKIVKEINGLHLSVNDAALDPIRQRLLAEIEELTGESIGGAVGPGSTYSYFKERTSEQKVPDQVIDSYYDPGRILEILAPEIQLLLGSRDPDQLSDAEMENIVQQAATRSRAELENYAAELAQKIVVEQEVYKDTDNTKMALEAAIEAGNRLANLVQIQSTDKGEYAQILQQLEKARASLSGDDLQVVNELAGATSDVLDALATV